MIKQENIDRIISDVSIRDVAKDEGITFSKERGGKLWACCPFHTENTPSFFVDTGTNTWKCYGGCHSGGNVISLYRKLKNDLPFPIACKELAKNISMRTLMTITSRAKRMRRSRRKKSLCR